jgi:hypothetical protein
MVTRSQPAPPATAPLPRPLQPAPPRRTRTALAVGVAAVSVFAAGAGGVAVGAHLSTSTAPAPPPATATAASVDQIRAATVDLCTRYATGYTALPESPSTAADVLPTLNYIGAALTDNPAADPQIRTAVTDSLNLDRGQAAHLSRTPAQGAIQPPPQWRGVEANAAAEHVTALCRAYRG